jgi:hypothetical protein
MPFCLTCETEYRDGFSECVDCGAVLSDEAPAGRRPRAEEAVSRIWRWVLVGAAVGTVVGMSVGRAMLVLERAEPQAFLPAMGTILVYSLALGGFPGAAGGLVMGHVSERVASRGARTAAAIGLGCMIGSVYGAIGVVLGGAAGGATALIIESRWPRTSADTDG